MTDKLTAAQLVDGLLYGISLPERLLRSAVGLTAGTAREIAEFVIPQAFQSSKSYQVAIRNSVNFLLQSVAEVPEEQAAVTVAAPAVPAAAVPGTETDPGRFVAKKAIANFIDITGLTTLHISPLWILAIVSDAAYGTGTYVQELAAELQKKGLIDNSSTIHRVDDLLESVRKASGTAATAFDLPPLSIQELRDSITQTRAALNEIDPTQLIPESEIRRLWLDMKGLAASENISLLGVSGALAMQTVETIRGVTEGTLAGLFVAGRIINRNIFSHYAAALVEVHRQGVIGTVRNTFEPYADLAWNNFAASRKTWTEQVLHPSVPRRLWRWVCGWFRAKPGQG
ncbi:MAG: hypothetical protein LW816_13455 [Planctomyces sp.]|jgi:hypothetical protein|nr:hypothetical protein [Planctomyces sp.]